MNLSMGINLSEFILGALFVTVFGYEIVRVFALFHYPPLIKVEDSKMTANHQTPACFMTQCYKLCA